MSCLWASCQFWNVVFQFISRRANYSYIWTLILLYFNWKTLVLLGLILWPQVPGFKKIFFILLSPFSYLTVRLSLFKCLQTCRRLTVSNWIEKKGGCLWIELKKEKEKQLPIWEKISVIKYILPEEDISITVMFWTLNSLVSYRKSCVKMRWSAKEAFQHIAKNSSWGV